MVQEMVPIVNRLLPDKRDNLFVQNITSNRSGDLERLTAHFENPEAEQPEIDCCFAHLFSWGHSKWLRTERDDLLERRAYQTYVGDFTIEVNESMLNLNSRTLWLNPADNDWHSPLYLYVRNHHLHQAKKTKIYKDKKRDKPYGSQEQAPYRSQRWQSGEWQSTEWQWQSWSDYDDYNDTPSGGASSSTTPRW